MTTATAPPKQAYFSTNDVEDTVCVMAMVQRIQSWQLFQGILPQLEDDVECTLAALAKRLGLSRWRLSSAIQAHFRMRELPLTTAVQTEHWILDLPRLQVIDVELRTLGTDEAQIQLVDAALADFLIPKDPRQHVPTEPEIRNFLRGFIDGLLKPDLSETVERAVSVSYKGGQATVVLKTDKATAAAIARHIDKAAKQEGISKAQALEHLIFDRTRTKVVINTYRTGGDPSRVFIPAAGWCALAEYLTQNSAVRTLEANNVAQYVPTAEIRAWVQGRDATCRWPGCSMPAHYCQLDHRVDYDEGGPTSAGNLVSLCQHHHNVKTDGRVRYVMDPFTGDIVWMFEDGTFEVDRAAGPLAPRSIHWKLTWEQFLKLQRRTLQGS